MSRPDGIKRFLPGALPRPCVRANTLSLQDWAPSAKLQLFSFPCLLIHVRSFCIACLLPPPKLERAAMQNWSDLTAAVTLVIPV